METPAIKVLTYNIHKGFSVGNVRFVLHQIRDALNQINADLVFLQEIQGEHSKRENRIHNWPQESQFEFLAEQLWPHYAYGKNAIYRSGHHGNAILSKFPFIKWENIDVSTVKRASRSILHGVLQPNGSKQPIHALCIHLSLFKSERVKQLQILCDRIESHVPHHEPLIIAGDFNDWRGHAESYLETHLEIQELFKHLTGNHAKTFPAWSPTLAVDRIYFRGLDAIDCHHYHKAPWQRLSDHIPLYGEFDLR